MGGLLLDSYSSKRRRRCSKKRALHYIRSSSGSGMASIPESEVIDVEEYNGRGNNRMNSITSNYRNIASSSNNSLTNFILNGRNTNINKQVVGNVNNNNNSNSNNNSFSMYRMATRSSLVPILVFVCTFIGILATNDKLPESFLRTTNSVINQVGNGLSSQLVGGDYDYFNNNNIERLLTTATLNSDSVDQYPFNNFLDVDEPPPTNYKPTGFYWQIPRAGGTSVKYVMSTCLRKVLASRIAGDYCDVHSPELEVCNTKVGLYVNADPSDHGGIQRCSELNLIQSGLADVIVSSRMLHAATLYDSDHKGRLFTVIRNPIDRAVSTFYYLRNADWERNYRPEFKDMTLLEYANLPDTSSNWMVRWLTGKNADPDLTREDLEFAKVLLKRKFLILLTEEMSSSVQRLIHYMGWNDGQMKDWSDNDLNEAKQCIHDTVIKEIGGLNQAIPGSGKSKVRVEKGTAEYDALLKLNEYDMELYHYAQELFVEQWSTLYKGEGKLLNKLFLQDLDSIGQDATKEQDNPNKEDEAGMDTPITASIELSHLTETKKQDQQPPQQPQQQPPVVQENKEEVPPQEGLQEEKTEEKQEPQEEDEKIDNSNILINLPIAAMDDSTPQEVTSTTTLDNNFHVTGDQQHPVEQQRKQQVQLEQQKEDNNVLINLPVASSPDDAKRKTQEETSKEVIVESSAQQQQQQQQGESPKLFETEQYNNEKKENHLKHHPKPENIN